MLLLCRMTTSIFEAVTINCISLSDCFGALRDGMLGQFSQENESDCCPVTREGNCSRLCNGLVIWSYGDSGAKSG